jgi:hypothetical protein
MEEAAASLQLSSFTGLAPESLLVNEEKFRAMIQ